METLAILGYGLDMTDHERGRQRDPRIFLPEHHEPCLAVPVRGETAGPASVYPSPDAVLCAAHGTISTGAMFFLEARSNTGLGSLVSQIVFDPAGLHLGDLLPGLPGEAFILAGVLLHPGRVPDDQLGHVMIHTPGDRLPGRMVKHIPHLVVGLGLEAPLGPDQLALAFITGSPDLLFLMTSLSSVRRLKIFYPKKFNHRTFLRPLLSSHD